MVSGVDMWCFFDFEFFLGELEKFLVFSGFVFKGIGLGSLSRMFKFSGYIGCEFLDVV